MNTTPPLFLTLATVASLVLCVIFICWCCVAYHRKPTDSPSESDHENTHPDPTLPKKP